MRFKSKVTNNYCVYGVTGVNTASFAIDFRKADTAGLIGFAIKRTYPGKGEYFLPGFKLFKNQKPNSKKITSTETDPVQSFVWDDFTLKQNQAYTYTFFPMTGKPGALVNGSPIVIKVKTEASFSNQAHDIFFNRGVASSQAYTRKFDNKSPDKLEGKKQQEAFDWLSRGLLPAMLKFIVQAKKGDTILGCFYEFNYLPVLQELKKAIDNGVHVRLIIDAKNNAKPATAKAKAQPATPRQASLKAIKTAGIPMNNVILRTANKNLLQHNKFMVYLKGASKAPVSVWTGSVNITESGIFGQTNVGHWVRDAATAKTYQKYWELLSGDPGAKDADSAAKKKEDVARYKKQVEALQKDIKGNIPQGITPIFSPRTAINMLEKYFSLADKAKSNACITLAFGITADLKKLLVKHTEKSPLTFMMLEKEDKPNARSKAPFFRLSAKNNVYEAFGSYIKNPIYDYVWAKETNMKNMNIAKFVVYIHSKFLIQDALGNDPIVVTGSANFSLPSTIGNDENMVIIRGDQRVADIYFTEFNRIFNHYYFRAILQKVADKKVKEDNAKYYLDDTDGWIKNYKPGSLRYKRVMMFANMENAKTL